MSIDLCQENLELFLFLIMDRSSQRYFLGCFALLFFLSVTVQYMLIDNEYNKLETLSSSFSLHKYIEPESNVLIITNCEPDELKNPSIHIIISFYTTALYEVTT